MKFNSSYLYLSVQRALLGTIVPQVRAVTINFDETTKLITLHVFYDGEIPEQFFDLVSCLSAEIDTDPPIYHQMNDDLVVRLDSPAVIPVQGKLVYLRYETNLVEYPTVTNLFLQEKLPIAALHLLMQEVLLGRIKPSLRGLSVRMNEDQKDVDCFFYYDGIILQEDQDLADEVIDETNRLFAGFSINKHLIRLDSPEKLPNRGGTLVYLRNEEDL